MAIKVLGLVDCFNSPEFGPMTKHRSVASTSFLGRYAFIDFQLSNFLNSRIPSISTLFLTAFQRGTGDFPVTIFSSPAASTTSSYKARFTVERSMYTVVSSDLKISSRTSFVPR